IAALERLADALLPEAVAVEQETTILLLKQVAEDMSYDLSIDLIRETIYGYSLEMLGSFEPREESDYLMLEGEERYLYMLLQAYAGLVRVVAGRGRRGERSRAAWVDEWGVTVARGRVSCQITGQPSAGRERR